MAGPGVSTDSLDYLQRSGPLRAHLGGSVTAGGPATRRLLRVSGIGLARNPGTGPLPQGEPWRSPMAGVLTGLYGYRIPVAYLLGGRDGAVEVQVGT